MTHTGDPYDLARFVDAQRPMFDGALAELRAGRKRGHWMWFVFPQLRGLGISPTARHFGIASRDEARAFLAHPLLGPRLVAATRQVLAAPTPRDLHAIFGSPDDLKFRSSMTLFLRVGEDDRTEGGEHGVFRQALEAFCAGVEDERTVALLAR